jgi:hypothetical protein
LVLRSILVFMGHIPLTESCRCFLCVFRAPSIGPAIHRRERDILKRQSQKCRFFGTTLIEYWYRFNNRVWSQCVQNCGNESNQQRVLDIYWNGTIENLPGQCPLAAYIKIQETVSSAFVISSTKGQNIGCHMRSDPDKMCRPNEFSQRLYVVKHLTVEC